MNANTADLSRTETKIKIFQPVTANSVCSLHEYCVGNTVMWKDLGCMPQIQHLLGLWFLPGHFFNDIIVYISVPPFNTKGIIVGLHHNAGYIIQREAFLTTPPVTRSVMRVSFYLIVVLLYVQFKHMYIHVQSLTCQYQHMHNFNVTG